MSNKRSVFARTATNWTVAIGLLVILLFAAVGPAFAAGGTIQSITVGSQGSALTYGTPGTASFQVSVASTGTISNVAFNAAGLPAGATWAFVPAKLSFSGAQTKVTTLTITSVATTPAAPNRPFTVGYKVAGKAGTVVGTGHLTIDPRLLDVTGKLVQDKLYDGNTNATLNPGCTSIITTDCASLVGVINGDVVTLNTATGHGVFSAKDSGAEDVSVTGLTIGGTGASNYALPGVVSSSATINPTALTVTADPAFKVFGFPDPVFTMKYSGFVNNETAAILTPAPTCVVSVPHDEVNTYPITCGGGNAQNYTFSYVDGILSVVLNDHAPTDISLSPASVVERRPVGTVVGGLTATDEDSSLGETYKYTLLDAGTCPDNAFFSIPGYFSAGPVPLQTAASFHYVTKSSYTVCVEVNDGNGGTFDKNLPVAIQPSTLVLTSQGTLDGWVLESSETSGIGGTMNVNGTTLLVGDNKDKKQYRSILSFSTGGLRDDATIYGVTLRIKKQQLTNTNLFSLFRGLHVDVIKPSYGQPALQLTDFRQAATLTTGIANACLMGATPDANGWYSSVSTCAKAVPFINKVGSTQFRLYFGLDDNNNNIANYLAFYSGNVAPANRPQLVITYSVP